MESGKLRHEQVAYSADGLDMVGDLFRPDGEKPALGLLVFPEALGLGDHARARAARLADLGYVAMACDLHGGGRVIADLSSVMGIVKELIDQPERVLNRARAPLDVLLARKDILRENAPVAIGHCFGGTMAIELARTAAPIAAAIGFHSGLKPMTAASDEPIIAKILAFIGADDPGIGPDQRLEFEEEMRHRRADWQLKLFGGVVHSFTNPDADALGQPAFARFDAAADRRSWAEMRLFLGELVAQP